MACLQLAHLLRLTASATSIDDAAVEQVHRVRKRKRRIILPQRNIETNITRVGISVGVKSSNKPQLVLPNVLLIGAQKGETCSHV